MRIKAKWIGKKSELVEIGPGLVQVDPPVLMDDFRPLAILAKLCLVLPVKNIITNGENFYFKWLSIEILSIPILHLSVSYFLASKIIYHDGYGHNISINAGLWLMSNMLFTFGQQHFFRLLEDIKKFDNSMLLNPKAFYYKRVHKFLWVFGSFIYPLMMLSKVAIAKYRNEPCLKFKCANIEMIRSVLTYQYQLQLIIYTFFCYELKHRFKIFNVVFYDFIKTSYLGRRVVGDNHIDFENHRLQYHHLIQCTKTLNSLYGIRFSFILGLIILKIMLVIYYFYTVKGSLVTGYNIITTAYNIVLILVVTHNTDLLIVELMPFSNIKPLNCILTRSQKIESYLNLIPTQELNWNTLFQLDHTLQQCEMFRVNISACGMVDIDRSLLLSMAGAIAMYFIAILQMTTTVGSFSW